MQSDLLTAPVRYAKLQKVGAAGIISLERPERLNAISAELLDDFRSILDTAMQDPALAVLILRGEGRAFCAGNDLKELSSLTSDVSAAEKFVSSIQDVSRVLLGSDKIIIAAAHGYAVGGGLEWLLNCDLVVASDDLVAFFPEMRLGQFVTGGVTYLLPRLVGTTQAMELLLLGERQDALRLHQLGLVNRVVPLLDLMPTCLQFAEAVSGGARKSVAGLKRTIAEVRSGSIEDALRLEAQLTCAALSREEALARAPRQRDRET